MSTSKDEKTPEHFKDEAQKGRQVTKVMCPKCNEIIEVV